MVSVITPTYNSEKFILDAYRSLASQTYSDWEWVVTDDCSSDKSYEVLRKLAKKDDRVKIFRNTINCGAGVTRNNSLENATKKYIAFLDADDLWLPDKLDVQLREMKKGSYSFTFTGYGLVSESGVPLKKTVDDVPHMCVSYEDMLRKKATIGCSTVILDSTRFDDLSMLPIRTGQDYALWLKLLRSGESATLIPRVLTLYRLRSDSISSNKLKKAIRQWQIYRNIENIGLGKSIMCFICYAWRAVFR